MDDKKLLTLGGYMHKEHNHCHQGACQITRTGTCGCNCADCKCNHAECGSRSCDFSQHLLKLADEAWMEVLKEKVKEKIRESDGTNLDALAQLISDSNGQRWKNKIGAQKAMNEFKAQLENLFK